MINQEKWIGSLPNINVESRKVADQLDHERWMQTIPKKEKYRHAKKYSLFSILFVLGLLLVSAVKNETRNLQKEIGNLQASISTLKTELHKANLEHEVITSPENISKLAEEHLNDDLIYYKKSQIKNLDSEQVNLAKTENKNKKELSKEMKIIVKKQISKKMEELEKLQEIYSKPEKLPDEIKYQVAQKINKTKSDLKKLYSDPSGSINTERVQKWAAVQVVKAFLGIPVIPGR